MWAFSTLMFVVSGFFFQAYGASLYPDEGFDHYTPVEHPTYWAQVGLRTSEYPKPAIQEPSGSGGQAGNGIPLSANHGIISGVHLVAVTAPQPLLSGADGQNILQLLFQHLLHEAQHGHRTVIV